jgi:hypothetical protein
MRLVKLSPDDEDFPDELELQNYFRKRIWERNGEFYFCASGHIGANGIRDGELVLFQYQGQLRFVARSASGRIKNPLKQFPSDGYNEYFFQVNLASLQETEPTPIADLQQRLYEEAGFTKSLHVQGWNKLPDDEKIEKIVDKYIRASVPCPRTTTVQEK